MRQPNLTEYMLTKRARHAQSTDNSEPEVIFYRTRLADRELKSKSGD